MFGKIMALFDFKLPKLDEAKTIHVNECFLIYRWISIDCQNHNSDELLQLCGGILFKVQLFMEYSFLKRLQRLENLKYFAKKS
ncbi:hypothetical protein CSC3H3_21265 (plasmid) [Thalassospira marina]|uniref:Uncharacterized protein n=1 Tax=Thalassospira marina TaxID=2048283 RepID=A0ABN5FJZ9_9PROT|nr:hypothetical protein CSC3H3_21265 [Thalassospira marina]